MRSKLLPILLEWDMVAQGQRGQQGQADGGSGSSSGCEFRAVEVQKVHNLQRMADPLTGDDYMLFLSNCAVMMCLNSGGTGCMSSSISPRRSPLLSAARRCTAADAHWRYVMRWERLEGDVENLGMLRRLPSWGRATLGGGGSAAVTAAAATADGDDEEGGAVAASVSAAVQVRDGSALLSTD